MTTDQESIVESNLELALGQMMACLRLRKEGRRADADLRHDNALLYLQRAAFARMEVLADNPPLA